MASRKKHEREVRVEAAVEEVSHGQQSLRIAGNWFNIPKSTLPHWKNYCNPVHGRPTILTEAEEKAIVRPCQ